MQENEQKNSPLDIDFLRGIIDNDLEFKKELFALFKDSAEKNIAELERALAENSNNNWYMAAHSFKGACASIGAFGLSKVLEYMQKHPEENYDQKAESLKTVKEKLVGVMEFLDLELSSMQ